ncbi:hypothetical protein NDU88_001766 [Pleurodeles waltl]|uniref:Secreted protein n=1 Tax=Pleurodeles waltl TaxID=8319 RepID=A0AAV7LYL0_PLEWA|nr:hypothetical protein NDU88_001766 [Pleurodeles waltl]
MLRRSTHFCMQASVVQSLGSAVMMLTSAEGVWGSVFRFSRDAKAFLVLQFGSVESGGKAHNITKWFRLLSLLSITTTATSTLQFAAPEQLVACHKPLPLLCADGPCARI